MDKIVYVAGSDIITALGVTTAENFRNVTAEKSGISVTNDPALYPCGSFQCQRIKPEDEKNITKRWATDSCPQLETRLERLMAASVAEAAQHCPEEITSSNKTVYIFATTKGNIGLLSGNQHNKELPQGVFLHEMARRVTSCFNKQATPIVVSNACISGVLAVVTALRMLRTGKYEHAIVVGGDELTEFTISGFMSFHSISPLPCRPYDKSRDGLTPGEGVATLVLTTHKEHCHTTPAIMIAGGSSSNDANHISGPSRTGDGLCFAMQDAISDAGLMAKDIDLVDAHGTATAYNDEMEAKALHLAGLQHVPLLSLKGYFGHTLGASGLIETIVSIEALKSQIIPRTLNFLESGVPVEVNVSTSTQTAHLSNILKTASGFGGSNAALVISTSTAGICRTAHGEIKELHTCSVGNGTVVVDNMTTFSADGDFPQFIRAAFRNICPGGYMKFAKMDDLCKTALTATEYLLQNAKEWPDSTRDVAVVLSCNSASLDTDTAHQSAIECKEPYIPSPAIFVYTLANIMQGEICIRHKIKGENLCLVTPDCGITDATEQAILLMRQGHAKWCIAGHVDFLRGNYMAHLKLLKLT